MRKTLLKHVTMSETTYINKKVIQLSPVSVSLSKISLF